MILSGNTNHLSSVFQRTTEALESGAIPVFLCLPDCQNFRFYLPFQETIDWSKFSIFLPAVRVTEAHFLLRSFPDTGNSLSICICFSLDQDSRVQNLHGDDVKPLNLKQESLNLSYFQAQIDQSSLKQNFII